MKDPISTVVFSQKLLDIFENIIVQRLETNCENMDFHQFYLKNPCLGERFFCDVYICATGINHTTWVKVRIKYVYTVVSIKNVILKNQHTRMGLPY